MNTHQQNKLHNNNPHVNDIVGEDLLTTENQQQIIALVQSFMRRTEIILAALSMGATFFEIEAYLDRLDQMTPPGETDNPTKHF